MLWLLHGNLSSSRDFSEYFSALDVEIQVVDLWCSYGGPSAGLVGWAKSFNRHVAKVDQNPFLLGYSLGGRLALHALDSRCSDSKIWKKACVVSAHAGLTCDSERQARLAKDLSWAEKLCSIGPREFLDIWNSQAVFAVRSSSIESQTMAVEKYSKQMAIAFDRWSLGRQDKADLSNLACETKWITGEDDLKFDRLAKGYSKESSGLSFETIKDAGHRVYAENNAIFLEALKSFFYPDLSETQ